MNIQKIIFHIEVMIYKLFRLSYINITCDKVIKPNQFSHWIHCSFLIHGLAGIYVIGLYFYALSQFTHLTTIIITISVCHLLLQKTWNFLTLHPFPLCRNWSYWLSKYKRTWQLSPMRCKKINKIWIFCSVLKGRWNSWINLAIVQFKHGALIKHVFIDLRTSMEYMYM